MIVFQLFVCYINIFVPSTRFCLNFLAFIIILYYEVLYVLLAIFLMVHLARQAICFTRCFP